MLHTTPKVDLSAIQELIRDAERRHSHRLCITDFDFLTAAVATFMKAAIEKFVAGAKEHHQENQDFVNGVDHANELGKEILDFWMYHLADQLRKKAQQQNKTHGN